MRPSNRINGNASLKMHSSDKSSLPDRTAAAPLEKRINGNPPLSYSPI